MSWADALLRGVLKSYPGPHCGRPGEQGGSAPRDACSGGGRSDTPKGLRTTPAEEDEYARQSREILDSMSLEDRAGEIVADGDGMISRARARAIARQQMIAEGRDPNQPSRMREKLRGMMEGVVPGSRGAPKPLSAQTKFQGKTLQEMRELARQTSDHELLDTVNASVREGSLDKLQALIGRRAKKSYPGPHCGRPGQQGGSAPRGECAGGGSSIAKDAGLLHRALADTYHDQARKPGEFGDFSQSMSRAFAALGRAIDSGSDKAIASALKPIVDEMEIESVLNEHRDEDDVADAAYRALGRLRRAGESARIATSHAEFRRGLETRSAAVSAHVHRPRGAKK